MEQKIYCYDCYKEKSKHPKNKNQLVFSEVPELCENCNRKKRIVLKEKLSDAETESILSAYAKKESGKFGTDAEMFDDLKNTLNKD